MDVMGRPDTQEILRSILSGQRSAVTYAHPIIDLQTGHMAADILEGKKKPGAMAIETAKTLKVSINKKDAALLGITIPEDVLKGADIVE